MTRFSGLGCLTVLLAAVSVAAAPASGDIEIDLRSLANADLVLEKRQYSGSDTENQLYDGTPCRPLTLVFARGTFETGNMGTIVGPPLAQALVQLTGPNNLAVQGVNYSADVFGFFSGGSAAGASDMAQAVGTALTNCPNTKLAISGYSQGAQVTHKAAVLLNTQQTAFVNSVVTFGDPDQHQSVGGVPANDVLVICAPGDDICTGGFIINSNHLSYGQNASQAAQFIYGKSGLGT